MRSPSQSHSEGKWKGRYEDISSGCSDRALTSPSLRFFRETESSEEASLEGQVRETLVLERHKVKSVSNQYFFFRSKIGTLNKPKIVSNKAKSVSRVPDLTGMLQMFKGEESQGKGVCVGGGFIV